MKDAETSCTRSRGDSQSEEVTHGTFVFLPGKGHIWPLKGQGSVLSGRDCFCLFMPSLPRSVESE